MASDNRQWSGDHYLDQVEEILLLCRGKVIAAAEEYRQASRRALAELEVDLFPEELN